MDRPNSFGFLDKPDLSSGEQLFRNRPGIVSLTNHFKSPLSSSLPVLLPDSLSSGDPAAGSAGNPKIREIPSSPQLRKYYHLYQHELQNISRSQSVRMKGYKSPRTQEVTHILHLSRTNDCPIPCAEAIREGSARGSPGKLPNGLKNPCRCHRQWYGFLQNRHGDSNTRRLGRWSSRGQERYRLGGRWYHAITLSLCQQSFECSSLLAVLLFPGGGPCMMRQSENTNTISILPARQCLS